MELLDIDFKYTETKYKMYFDLNYPTQSLLYNHFNSNVICDPPMVETILECVKPNSTVIDVGCHIGYYTLIIRQKIGDNGFIYAFDPNPYTFCVFVDNIVVNNYSNIYAFNLALSNCDTISTLSIPEYDEGLSTMCEIENINSEKMTDNYRIKKTVTAITKRMDSIFQNKRNLDVSLIKIDVEGFEEYVINGGSEFIKNNRPENIIFEINKFVPNQKENQLLSILEFLIPLGYTPHILCPWPTEERTLRVFNGKNYLPLNYFEKVEKVDYANILMKLEV